MIQFSKDMSSVNMKITFNYEYNKPKNESINQYFVILWILILNNAETWKSVLEQQNYESLINKFAASK